MNPVLPSFLRVTPIAVAALACCLAVASMPAYAQTSAASTELQNVAIAPGPLDKVLNQFASITGLMLAIDGELTAGKQSNGLSGRYTVEEGLSRLLQGTGLTAVRLGNGGYAVRRTAVGADADKLPEVTVRGDKDGAGLAIGYLATRSTSASKTDTPLAEIPRSLSIVTSEQITAQQASDLNDALGYSPGVVRAEGADRTTDSFMIRGFSAGAGNGNLYRDGAKYMVNPYDGQQELYGLERVELLRGAASVLYGTSAPGGIINTVTKKPSVDPVRELGIELGNFNRKQIKGDFSGPLSADGVWTYRLTGLLRESDTFIDHVPDDRQYLAAALAWRPDARTSLTLQADYVRSRTDYVYGMPGSGTILPNVNGSIPSNRYIGLVGHDKYDGANTTLGYLFEHLFDNGVKLRHSFHAFRSIVEFPSSGISGNTAGGLSTYRGATERDDYSKAFSSDTSLEYKLQTGSVQHTLLAGSDTTFQYHTTRRYNRTVTPQLNYYDPSYSYTLGPLVRNVYFPDSAMHDTGVYLQDQMKFGERWVVLLGGRRDWASDRLMMVDGSGSSRETSTANTGHAGLVYLADNGLAPYVSFSQSFQPESGIDRLGNRFKPTQGEQYEVGIRYQPKDSGIMLSAALYQLTQQNVLTTDPIDTQFSVQTGEVRSRGVELEARSKVGAHANLIAAFAYTDAITTKDNTPANVGKRTGNVPVRQASVWMDYDFGRWDWRNLKVGGGVRYVGDKRGTYVAGTVPSYVLIDAMIAYDTGAWRLALNATNLGDREYVASCTYGCFYGERRKMIASAVYRW